MGSPRCRGRGAALAGARHDVRRRAPVRLGRQQVIIGQGRGRRLRGAVRYALRDSDEDLRAGEPPFGPTAD